MHSFLSAKVNLILISFFLSLKLSFSQNVIGYIPYWKGDVSNIQYDKLTHINYSFAIPDVDGHLKPLQNSLKLQKIVTDAHAVGVKVLIAVGGWSENGVTLDSRFESIGANATFRTNMVNDIVSLINQYNLDGVDMDWEFPDAGSSADNFEALMTELYNALHPKNKLVTAAVAGSAWGGSGIKGSVKNVVDWLNIMAYDFNNQNHSTYSDAISAISYYQNKGFSNNQLALGVPFYGRPTWESYVDLVNRGADPYSDSFDGVGYNGITTIKKKTDYVVNNGLAGIMIWEISQDSNDQFSLLTAISEGLNPNGNKMPLVTIDSPSNNSLYTEGDDFSIKVTASDPDGTVDKVELLLNGNKIDEDINAPYNFDITNVQAGNHTLVAKVTDNLGAISASQVINIFVNSISNGNCSAPIYVHSTAYLGGSVVSYNNHTWEANWWTQNEVPSNGGTGVWKDLGACSTGGPNTPPTVSITSPVNNSQVDVTSNVSIKVNAADSDGSVTKVEFYSNGVKLGEDITSPYSYDVGTLQAGTYNLTAVATDNGGDKTTSSIIVLTVNPVSGNCSSPAYIHGNVYLGGSQVTHNGHTWKANWWTQNEVPSNGGTGVWKDLGVCSNVVTNTPPTVSITSPVDGSQINEGTNIVISVDAADSDGSVTKVEFYSNGVKIGEDAIAPYSLDAGKLSAGTYDLTAVATDNDGDKTTSSIVGLTINKVIINLPPTVTIISPTDGSQINAGSDITIDVNATDSDGTISKLEFYSNGVKLGEVTNSNFTFDVKNIIAGTYYFNVIAIDDSGNSTSSSTVTLIVNSVNTSSCTAPAYVHGNVYLGGTEVSHNGHTWKANWWTQNETPSATGTGVWKDLGTCSGGNNNNNTNTGSCSKPAYVHGSVYLGGSEVSHDGHTWKANWWTQNEKPSSNGSGVWKDLGACSNVVTNTPPTVSITSPINGSKIGVNTDITIFSDAADSDGSITKVEFYSNGVKLGEDINAPYSLNIGKLNAGNYYLTAMAYDNDGDKSISPIISLTVAQIVSNQLPTVSITSPSMNSDFKEGTIIDIKATATDSDGSISKVNFYLNGIYDGEDANSPYEYSFNNLAVGDYTVSVEAIDNDGNISIKPSVNFTVSDNNTNTNNGCTDPQYVEGIPLSNGDLRQNNNNLYVCNVPGWCEGAAWAYEPGVGLYWTTAWSFVSVCNNSAPKEINFNANIFNINDNAINLEINSFKESSYKISVFNMSGKMVYNNWIKGNSNEMLIHTINNTEWSRGIYIINVLSGNDNKTLKVAK